MTERIPLAQLTKDSLDALYERLEAAEATETQRQLATAREALASATERAAHAEAERNRWLAFIERGMDTHTQFSVIRDDGTLEQLPCADWCYACRLERTETERDGAYRERAQLLALLASLHPSVIAPAPDVDEPGWQILYLRIGGKQASWHITPRDAELFTHVEHVPADDRRAQWDGHTSEQKYAHIGEHAARLYADARSRVETPLEDAS